MPPLTDGRQAASLPTWQFWVLVLLVFPVASLVLLLGGGALGVPPALTGVGTVAVVGALLSQERAIRRMQPRWRVAWAAAGCVITVAVTEVAAVGLFFALLNSW